MPRKQKKYHYLYKTTNLINGKFYVGMHSTDDLHDGYLGSGKYLWNSIRKYGKDKFKTEILEFFDDRKTLVEKEKNLINEEFIKDPMCMNLKLGGSGGFVWDEIFRKFHSDKMTELNKILWKDADFIKRNKKRSSTTLKKLWEEKIVKHTDWTGKNHAEDSKIKIGNSSKKHQTGTGNSQFGTCWIWKNAEIKKIKKEELEKWINDGW